MNVQPFNKVSNYSVRGQEKTAPPMYLLESKRIILGREDYPLLFATNLVLDVLARLCIRLFFFPWSISYKYIIEDSSSTISEHVESKKRKNKKNPKKKGITLGNN